MLWVGLVGDSWASGHKLDAPLARHLSARGVAATVVSSGHPGTTSRQIMRDMGAAPSTPGSSRELLMNGDWDCLVIIDGVNDTAGHMGSGFYAHHMVEMIGLCRRRGLPVFLVLEVPEYGIESLPDTGWLSKAKHILFRYLFDGRQVNVIAAYRKALADALIARPWDIPIISFSAVTTDYTASTNLYANPSHLNGWGREALAAAIADAAAALSDSMANVTKGATFF